MNAAWDRGEEYHDPARKEYILGQDKKTVWTCGKNISKTRWRHWRRHWNVWRIPTRIGIWFLQFVVASLCRRNGFQHRWRKDFAKRCGKGYWEGVWPYLDPWDVVRLRTSSWNVPRKYGPHGELFFSIKTEPFGLTEAVQFKPFVPAETVKACALVG